MEAPVVEAAGDSLIGDYRTLVCDPFSEKVACQGIWSAVPAAGRVGHAVYRSFCDVEAAGGSVGLREWTAGDRDYGVNGGAGCLVGNLDACGRTTAIQRARCEIAVILAQSQLQGGSGPTGFG